MTGAHTNEAVASTAKAARLPNPMTPLASMLRVTLHPGSHGSEAMGLKQYISGIGVTRAYENWLERALNGLKWEFGFVLPETSNLGPGA